MAKEENKKEELEIYKKYEKIEKIGQGAFGIIYKARNRETKELVAIKEIPLIELENMNLKEETEKEIKFMQIFNNNNNSVKIYDKYEQNNTMFIVMDLCDGDLSKYLENSENGFSIYEIKVIFKQLNNILYEIRKRNMIHFDVKLENVLIKFSKNSKEFQIKLADYGSMKLLSPTKDLSNNEWGIAPFTEGGKEAIAECEKVDLLNLGIDMYRMLFKDAYKSFEEMLDKINKNINDEDLKDLLNKLLVEDYKERIDWEDYFNHKFFNIEKFDYDKVENIKI
jgi:serine/threonine protein kinase